MNKIRKLLNLPKAEISFRIREKLFAKFEHIQHVFNSDQLTPNSFNTKILNLDQIDIAHALMDNHQFPDRDLFFTEVYNKENRKERILKCGNAWRDEAEKILSEKLTLLGHEYQMPSNDTWHKDPKESGSWPKTFYTKVKNEEKIKSYDIKYIWELNRLQFLIVLAKAYWLTKDERYAQKIVSITTSWIANNRYNSGVNWTSSLELAVRALAWIWTFFLCRNSRHFTTDFQLLLFKSLFEHGKYIERHLSVYSSPYNHLIGEVAALHVIGALFSHLYDDAKRWERKAWGILVDQVEQQFHLDGLTIEQATFYHHFTLGFYLQSVMLRKINSKEVPAKVLTRLEKATEFAMYMTKPDGTLPMIGDIDNARSLYFSGLHTWDFCGFLAISAALFNRPDFKYRVEEHQEELLWLASDNVLGEYDKLEALPPPHTSLGFTKSGYYISRDSWKNTSNYLCFDCGEIADGLYPNAIPSAAHGHADALSFNLSVNGKSFLIDGGFFTYFGKLAWHKHFREEEAHNTVKIQNHRQAEYCGRLTWQCVKKPKLLNWKTTKIYDFVSGRIDYTPDVYHERKILYLKGKFWLVCDFVSAKNNAVESYLHFDPAVELSINENTNTLNAINNGANILVKLFQKNKIQAVKGGNDPSEGWVGLGYGIKSPGWRVRFKWDNYQDDLIIFPMLIIPRKDMNSSIEVEESELLDWPQKQFQSSFKIDKTHYSLIIDNAKNIKVTTAEEKIIIK